MKIGIIGSGTVGGTLGKRWSAKGHSMCFSTRDPRSEKMQRLRVEVGSSAKAGSLAETMQESELLLLASPCPAAREMLESAGDFNTVGNSIMADPHFLAAAPAMLFRGDDAAAKQTVAPLIQELGFDPVEPFALLWTSMAVKYGFGREIAFQFPRR
jgi:predicted dinucleotide-binding enzyme